MEKNDTVDVRPRRVWWRLGRNAQRHGAGPLDLRSSKPNEEEPARVKLPQSPGKAQGIFCMPASWGPPPSCIALFGVENPGTSPGTKATPSPSASSTTATVRRAAFDAPPPAVAPALREEHHWAAALHEARLLERRQLIDGGGHDHAAGQVATRVVPRKERRVERADQLEQAVRGQARCRPYAQVAGHEQRRRAATYPGRLQG